MKGLISYALFGVLLIIALTPAQAAGRQEEIQFRKGATSATIKGKIKGDQFVDYQLRAGAGQSISVRFKPTNPSAYFNVLPPGSETALFVGSTSGNEFQGKLSADGVYTIRVYLMRNAARRRETANYTVEVSILGGDNSATKSGAESQASPLAGASFDKTLELQGIRFRVTSVKEGSAQKLILFLPVSRSTIPRLRG